MNALQQARTAYASPVSPIRTERGTEYEAILRITRALRNAIVADEPNFKALVTALHDNQRLWTVIAANVADTHNDLPQDLRARLFYLAEFSLRHTRDVLARRAGPEVLVEINAAVLQGLRDAGPGADKRPQLEGTS